MEQLDKLRVTRRGYLQGAKKAIEVQLQRVEGKQKELNVLKDNGKETRT